MAQEYINDQPTSPVVTVDVVGDAAAADDDDDGHAV